MTKTKKLLTMLLIAVLSLTLLSGCASVNYAIRVLSDGTVEQGFTVALNADEITAAGYDLNTVKTMVVEQMNTVAQNAYDAFEARPLDSEIKQVVRNNFEANITYPSLNTICLTLHFGSVSVYRYFYGTLPETGEEEDTTITEKFVFYNKYIDENQTVFYQLSDNSIAQTMLAYFGGDFGYDDVSYSFSYGTPLSHLYSDANEVSYEDGVKTHTWNFTYDQLNNNIITYTFGINSGAWYLLALGMVAVFIASLLSYDYIKKRKKHKKVLLEKN